MGDPFLKKNGLFLIPGGSIGVDWGLLVGIVGGYRVLDGPGGTEISCRGITTQGVAVFDRHTPWV